MDWLELRPIRLFSLYLALMLLISTGLRLRQYQTVLSLVIGLKHRWPKLTQLVLTHRHIFLTWRTFLPTILVLAVLLANFLANRLIWPLADNFTLRDLLLIWPMLWPVVGFGMLMVGFDLYSTLRVGQIDQKMLEGYFDLAESWLTGWKAPVVRVLSLGYISPRKMVNDQVRDALLMASQMLHTNLWWMTTQTGLRIAFGLSLWTAYILEGPFLRLLGQVS